MSGARLVTVIMPVFSERAGGHFDVAEALAFGRLRPRGGDDGTGPAIGPPHLLDADRVPRRQALPGEEDPLNRRCSRGVVPAPDPTGRTRKR
jgi:hypothetical protein